MAYTNFKLETDSDGIALITWDMAGKSMNVFDVTTIAELTDIVAKTSADPAIKGVGADIRQGSIFRRCRPHDA